MVDAFRRIPVISTYKFYVDAADCHRHRHTAKNPMSANPSWKQFTVERLAREIGVLGEIIVDDVLFDLGFEDGELPPRQLMTFLARLQRELPETLDREAIIQELVAGLLSTPNS